MPSVVDRARRVHAAMRPDQASLKTTEQRKQVLSACRRRRSSRPGGSTGCRRGREPTLEERRKGSGAETGRPSWSWARRTPTATSRKNAPGLGICDFVLREVWRAWLGSGSGSGLASTVRCVRSSAFVDLREQWSKCGSGVFATGGGLDSRGPNRHLQWGRERWGFRCGEVSFGNSL